MSGTRLFIGLGNPGSEYENTYHNVGMLALDAIMGMQGASRDVLWQTHQKIFRYAKSTDIIFIKPLVFMNESGRVVREAIKKFGIAPENVTVIHDDSDLKVGEWKISHAQGAAGHHGVESIVSTLGANNFERIRVGIRPPMEQRRKKAGEFVLKEITKKDHAILDVVFSQISEELR